MNSNEPTLLFILGPPQEDGWKKKLFNADQQGPDKSDAELRKGWEEYERAITNLLFVHKENGRCYIEAVFSEVLKAPIRITDYELSWAIIRGLWHTCISIPFSALLVARGYVVQFPPDSDARKAIGYLLLEILRRDWIHVIAISRKIASAEKPLKPSNPAGRDETKHGGEAESRRRRWNKNHAVEA